MKLGHKAESPALWSAFARKYKTEMATPQARHDLELLAAFSHTSNFFDRVLLPGRRSLSPVDPEAAPCRGGQKLSNASGKAGPGSRFIRWSVWRRTSRRSGDFAGWFWRDFWYWRQPVRVT